MSAATAIDWNVWRANYDRMSFAEHQAFYAEVARQHPEQKCWNADACRRFLTERQPHFVAELGGWDGSLAAEMIPEFVCIGEWCNYDIAPDVPQNCDGPIYKSFVLPAWPWSFDFTRPVCADALIASHVFEHMRMREIESLIYTWEPRSIYIDCPISSGAQSWHNYEGSHILEVGSTELLWRLEQLGYTASHVQQDGGLIAYLDRK